MIEDITCLPPELGYQIFKYCAKPDLINLACSSRSHYEAVKYILYNKVRIPWKVLETETFAEEHLNNLNYTTSLRFVSYGLNALFNKIIWHSVADKYRDVIVHTNPDLLTSLELEGLIINENHAVPILVPGSVQELSVIRCLGISSDDWEYIAALEYLSRLSVNQSSIRDDDVECLAMTSSITEFSLTRCNEVSAESLVHLSNLGTLRKLKIVECKNISPDGYVNLGELSDVKDLILLDVHITDYAMSSFTRLQSLKHLQLKCSSGDPFEISDNSFGYIGELKTLESVSVNWMYIGDNGINNMSSIVSLKHLNINGCSKVGDAGFESVCNFSALTHVDVSNCVNVTDDGLRHVVRLKSLKYLNLTGCILITNDGLSHVSKLSAMEELHLCHLTQLSDDGVNKVCACARLRHLDISGCYEVTDFGLFHVHQYLQGLNVITLTGCTNVTNVGLSYLTSLRLVDIDVSLDLFSGQGKCMKIDDAGIEHLTAIRTLTQLNLSCCDYISDEAMTFLGELTSLQVLKLSCCIKLSDKGLERLSLLPYLRDLDISMCVKITDAGIAPLCKMNALKRIDVHGCSNVSNTWPSLYPYITFKYHSLNR